MITFLIRLLDAFFGGTKPPPPVLTQSPTPLSTDTRWSTLLPSVATSTTHITTPLSTSTNTTHTMTTLTPENIENTDTMYPDWNTRGHARHNVRVICDLVGLSYVKNISINGKLYSQKDVLTACVDNESGFLTNPTPMRNKDKVTGKVWSTDWGIVQVNDWFHISGMGNPHSGNEFPSVAYVLANPEACVRWMATYFKVHGNLSPWVSYSTGVYKHYL